LFEFAVIISQPQELEFAKIQSTKILFLAAVALPTETDKLQTSIDVKIDPEAEPPKVLCPHCLRTATNGIQCKGICVADNDY
jgi:hypothetical protein